MRTEKKPCSHQDVEILSVTPAQPDWAVATLHDPTGDHPDLVIDTVAAWALVQCRDCATKMVAPMTADRGALQVEMPKERDELVDSTIVQPGNRAVVRVQGGHRYLSTEPGAWVPGDQELVSESEVS